MTDQRPEPLSDPGVPTLLRRLSDFTGESVYLWYTPRLSPNDQFRWRVWTGAPAGTGGGEWGHGPTPYRALHAAFESVVRSTFEGRIGAPVPSTADGALADAAVAALEAIDTLDLGLLQRSAAEALEAAQRRLRGSLAEWVRS
jgi:hypothetical protein